MISSDFNIVSVVLFLWISSISSLVMRCFQALYLVHVISVTLYIMLQLYCSIEKDDMCHPWWRMMYVAHRTIDPWPMWPIIPLTHDPCDPWPMGRCKWQLCICMFLYKNTVMTKSIFTFASGEHNFKTNILNSEIFSAISTDIFYISAVDIILAVKIFIAASDT